MAGHNPQLLFGIQNHDPKKNTLANKSIILHSRTYFNTLMFSISQVFDETYRLFNTPAFDMA